MAPSSRTVLDFPEPNFHGQIIAELERLRESDTVNVVDALAVHKDADGNVEVMHLSNLSDEEAVELGTKAGALIGLGIEGENGMEAYAAASAALVLLEHRWAIPLRGPAAPHDASAADAEYPGLASFWISPDAGGGQEPEVGVRSGHVRRVSAA